MEVPNLWGGCLIVFYKVLLNIRLAKCLLGSLIEELDMNKKIKRFGLRFKENGAESLINFIRTISTDPIFKKRVDKAMCLIFASAKEETDRDVIFRWLDKTFIEGQIRTEWDLFNLKYDYYKRKHDKKKMGKSWHIKLKYFEWVTELLEETDYVYFPDKHNTGQFIKEEEFKYLAYKLTEVLIKCRGYNTIARNFFLMKDKPAYKGYCKSTGRKITKGKLPHMTQILSKRGIIYCYRRPNKANLFVVGKNNPYFQLYNVVTNEDITNIHTKYNIDTTDKFIRQTFGKTLIPGKIEKEFRKMRSDKIKEKARAEADKRKIEKLEQKKIDAESDEDEHEEVVETEQQLKREAIVADFEKRMQCKYKR